MSGPLTAAWSILSDWALAVAGTAGTIALGGGKAIHGNHRRSKQNGERSKENEQRSKQNERRSKKNERYLEGTDDPNHDGINETVNETRERLENFESEFQEFRRETKREHAEVMRRMEGLSEQIDGGDP